MRNHCNVVSIVMPGLAGLMQKLRTTCAAESYVLSPACSALILALPPLMRVTEADAILILSEGVENETVNPEVELAVTINGTSPNVFAGIDSNAMVCGPFVIVNNRPALAAGLKF